jgi:hypothetical protein
MSKECKIGNVARIQIGRGAPKQPRAMIDAALSKQSTHDKKQEHVGKDQIGFVAPNILEAQRGIVFPFLWIAEKERDQ